MTDLPTGTVTFLFTDIEGSTRAWESHPVEMEAALRRHDAVVRAAIEAAGCRLLYLPPYSPDLNPIEMAFAKLKAHLRRIGARTIEALWRAIGDICALYSEQECSNYLKQAGYAPN